MSMLNIAKKLKIQLTEAKADTQRLIDFAGDDLAQRFLNIKKFLKTPENDLYFWIKNKTVDELERAVAEVEAKKAEKQLVKDTADAGAELVAETAHWKVYHITNFEASQKYGRDTQWCITGVNNYGDRYWNSYTERGIKFYFFITKGEYRPRGDDSKFAIALYPNDKCEVFDQQDTQVRLSDIPYIDEVSIPDIDFDYLYDSLYSCSRCDCALDDDDCLISPEGDVYCADCFQEYYFFCDECNECECIDDGYRTHDDHIVCARCLNYYYFECDECYEIYHTDDMHMYHTEDEYGPDDRLLCQDCYEFLSEKEEVEESLNAATGINEHFVYSNGAKQLSLFEELDLYKDLW